MSKVIVLSTAIVTLLTAKHPHIYCEIAPEHAPYPFATYNLENSVDDGTMENFVLEIDGWDAPENGDTIPLEMLMHELDLALNKQVIRSNGMAFVIYRDNRLPLTDPDKRLRGRRIRYQVRTFGGD